MEIQPDTRRSGRRRSEEKRERILDAAAAVFLEDGFAASMDRVARLADVSKQTLYSHFESKEGLYRAMAERLRWKMQDRIDPAKPVLDNLEAFGRAFRAKVTAPETVAMHRQLVGQATQFPELAALHDEHGPLRSLRLLGAAIEAAMARGEIRRDDPLIAAEQFIALCQGLVRHRLMFGTATTPTEAENEAAVARAVDVFMRAYRPEPGQP